MSVATLSETRVFERSLEYSLDKVLPGITEAAFDSNPLASILSGKLNTRMFGTPEMSGRGRELITGGTTIEQKINLGKNTSVKRLSSNWDTFDTTPSDTPRHWRGTWKEYSATVTLALAEINANRNPDAVADLVTNEAAIAMGSLIDTISADCYDSGGNGSAVTGLSTLVNANNTVQSLSGATYSRWNSRGISVRGTAPASVSFTASPTSFATGGIQNMRLANLGATEGTNKPQAILTTHAIYSFYEAALQPQERFQDARVADGGFQELLFKTMPVFPDPQCATGVMYFLNFDNLKLAIHAGADFTPLGFRMDPDSPAQVNPIYAEVQLCIWNRFLNNKIIGIVA